jgi:hypothetical protein
MPGSGIGRRQFGRRRKRTELSYSMRSITREQRMLK